MTLPGAETFRQDKSKSFSDLFVLGEESVPLVGLGSDELEAMMSGFWFEQGMLLTLIRNTEEGQTLGILCPLGH